MPTKTGYIDYYKLVMPRLRRGGLVLADNVLFHGQVLQPEVEGKSARAIQAFNELVASDKSVEKVMLTVRDGLFVYPKKVKPDDDLQVDADRGRMDGRLAAGQRPR